MRTAVVYWSGTGNTEIMAQEVAEGARAAGAETDLIEVSSFSPEQMDSYDSVAFGCPAMGDEELEDTEFLPVYENCRGRLAGKKTAIFGSYGWGDGEWIRIWEAQCKEDGAVLVQEGLMLNEEPDETGKEACRKLGKALA